MSAYSTYGAVELKSVVQRYTMLGLAISVTMHFGIIASLHFNLLPEDHLKSGIRPPITSIPIHVGEFPEIPGIVTPRPGTNVVKRNLAAHGVPVPVREETTGRTIPSQEELGHAYEPGGELGGSSLGSGTPEPIGEETPPEPFVPVQQPPTIVRSVVPVYPEVAVRAQLEGKVWVRIWVDKQGRAHTVEVVKSNNEIFNDAALAAARQFIFTPAYMNNGPVSVWVAVPFTFRLTGPGK